MSGTTTLRAGTRSYPAGSMVERLERAGVVFGSRVDRRAFATLAAAAQRRGGRVKVRSDGRRIALRIVLPAIDTPCGRVVPGHSTFGRLAYRYDVPVLALGEWGVVWKALRSH